MENHDHLLKILFIEQLMRTPMRELLQEPKIKTYELPNFNRSKITSIRFVMNPDGTLTYTGKHGNCKNISELVVPFDTSYLTK